MQVGRTAKSRNEMVYKNQTINACLSDTPMIMLCDRRYASVRGSSASKAGDQAEDGDTGVE